MPKKRPLFLEDGKELNLHALGGPEEMVLFPEEVFLVCLVPDLFVDGFRIQISLTSGASFTSAVVDGAREKFATIQEWRKEKEEAFLEE